MSSLEVILHLLLPTVFVELQQVFMDNLCFPMFLSFSHFQSLLHLFCLSTAANNPLEALLGDLCLGSSNGSIRVRVRETATILSVLELSSFR
jgi:hypothetical protein